MRITVFGASGKVGRLVVAELLRRGHTVVAFVHSTPLPEQPRLSVVKGDIHDRADVEKAIEGSEAVVSVLGSWGMKEKDVLSSAMQKIIPVMRATTIKRIVSLTGNGAGAPGDKTSWFATANRLMLLLAAPKVLRDGEDHIQLLADSDLDWTVLRSPVMNTLGDRAYRLAAKSTSPTIHRQAVANAMVDLVEHQSWVRQAPYINRT